ncbi:MAG TPA: SseB family protein [Acidimicrobiales bacterium]|nr:SseB family protein [Acidimicrobiales bacterium]
MGDLAEVARGFKGGRVDAEQFLAALLESELYCRRGAEIGFQAWGPPGQGWVSVYSSERTLLAGERQACPWFSGPGAHLLGLVPDGYGVVFDPGSDSQVIVGRAPAEQTETVEV